MMQAARDLESRISLEDVLELHDSAEHPLALADNLGDAYLLAASALYARVRTVACEAGLTFTTSPPYDYDRLPRLCLDDICSTAKIPYADNVASLRRMAARYPGRFRFVHVITAMARQNVVFHEGIHCLSRRLFLRLPAAQSFSDQQQLICDRLLEEATANASEHLTSSTIRSAEEGLFARRAIFVVNSVPARLLDAMGQADTFRMLFIGYLTSNFLYSSMKRKSIYQILETSIDTSALKRGKPSDVLETFRSCLGLSSTFRLRANEATLRQLGVDDSVVDALAFDFFQELGPGGRIDAYLTEATRMVIEGVGPPPLQRRPRTPDGRASAQKRPSTPK